MTTTGKVQQYLKTCDLRRARADETAKKLFVSYSTLSRRLRGEGMSYYELLIAERRRRCLEAMNDNPEIMGKQLMGMLGYTEINSFYRAYKQWTGTNFNCAGKKWQPTLLPICNHCGGLGRRVQG